MPKDPKKTQESGDNDIDESKLVEQKLEELIQPKFDQMQQVMMQAIETQFAKFAQKMGQPKTPVLLPTPVPKTVYPATPRRTPPPPPPLQALQQVKQEDSAAKKLMFGSQSLPSSILNLIQEKYPKESILQAANSTVALKQDNGEIFIDHFME